MCLARSSSNDANAEAARELKAGKNSGTAVNLIATSRLLVSLHTVYRVYHAPEDCIVGFPRRTCGPTKNIGEGMPMRNNSLAGGSPSTRRAAIHCLA